MRVIVHPPRPWKFAPIYLFYLLESYGLVAMGTQGTEVLTEDSPDVGPHNTSAAVHVEVRDLH